MNASMVMEPRKTIIMTMVYLSFYQCSSRGESAISISTHPKRADERFGIKRYLPLAHAHGIVDVRRQRNMTSTGMDFGSAIK